MYGQKRKKSKAKKPKGLTYAQVAQEIDKKISALQQRGGEGPIQQKTVGPLIQKLLEDKEALKASQEEARTKMYKDKVYAFQKKFQEDMLGLAGQAKYGGTIPKAEYGIDDETFLAKQTPGVPKRKAEQYYNRGLEVKAHQGPLNTYSTAFGQRLSEDAIMDSELEDFILKEAEESGFDPVEDRRLLGRQFYSGQDYEESERRGKRVSPFRAKYDVIRPYTENVMNKRREEEGFDAIPEGTIKWSQFPQRRYGGAIPKALFGIKKNRTEEEQAFYDKRNKALLDAGLTAAPTLYNLGRGIFEDQEDPVMSRNPYEEDIVRKGEEAEEAINPEAQIKENRKYLNFLKYLNKKKGSGSTYLGTVTSGLDKMTEANRKAVSESQKDLAKVKQTNQRTLLGLGEADAIRQEKHQDLRYKVDEQSKKLIGEGLTGLSDLHQNKKYMNNLMKNDFMKALIFDKYLNDPSGKGTNEVLDKFMREYFSEFMG